MKLALLLAAVVAVGSKASAYVCPSFQDVAYACKQLNVFPCKYKSKNLETYAKLASASAKH